jgi:hypothetical protein
LIVTIMSFEFERPIGAPADVIELDYVSALHQTDVQGGIRRDSSIQGAYDSAGRHPFRSWFLRAILHIYRCRYKLVSLITIR